MKQYLVLAWPDPVEAGHRHGEGGDLVQVKVERQIGGQVFPSEGLGYG